MGRKLQIKKCSLALSGVYAAGEVREAVLAAQRYALALSGLSLN